MLFLSAVLASATLAQTTAPADLTAAISRLDDRDPEVREAARMSLMSLTRDDLPRLREAVAGAAPRVTVRDALRDVVMHVYLTGKHNFAGAATAYLGIASIPAPSESPTVRSRMIGYDAYRALRDGDVIVALRPPPGRRRGEAENAFLPIRSIEYLQEILATVRVGEWIGVRVLRDGESVETRVRVGPRSPALMSSKGINPSLDEAREYWTREFAPALAPATRPATQ